MSQVCGRTSSAKDKASKVFYRKIKPASKDALPTGRAGTDGKCRKHSKSEPESKRRMKKLRSRKERNGRIRDGSKEAPGAKSRYHYYTRQTHEDVSHVHQCCHNTLDTHPNIPSVAHEPCVITDSRLIGHHGLFNHEIKSIDIERLLSEQRKLDRSEKLQGKRASRFYNPPASSVSNDAYDEAVMFDKQSIQSPKIILNSKRQVMKTMSCSQGSDLTPGQRPRKILSSLPESNKNDNCSDAVITEIKEAQTAVCEINSDARQTPFSSTEDNKCIFPGSLPSIIEHTPNKTVSAANPSQVARSTYFLPSSPPVAGASSCFIQENNLDADSVAMSVKAIAANLCNGISFSLLRENVDLVSESRNALVDALRQRHGDQLKSNILKVQRQLYSYDDEDGQVSLNPIFAGKKESLFSAVEFPTASKATGFATSSCEKTGRLPFDWNSTDWSNPLDQTTELSWTSGENLLVPDGTFFSRDSPQFAEEFEFRNTVSREKREHLFSSSFASSCLGGHSSSGHSDDFFIGKQGKQFAMSESTNNDMTFSNIRTIRHRRSPPNYSVDPLHSSFETHQYPYGKSFGNKIPHFHKESYFEPSRCASSPSASSGFRPVDLANYPPSYAVERGPILSTSSSFPSPVHWSFPPMRLY